MPAQVVAKPRRFRYGRWAGAFGLLLVVAFWAFGGVVVDDDSTRGLVIIAGILALVAAGLLVLGNQGRGAAVTALVVVSFAAGGWGISMIPARRTAACSASACFQP